MPPTRLSPEERKERQEERQRNKAARDAAPQSRAASQDKAPSSSSGSTSKVADDPGRKLTPKQKVLETKIAQMYNLIGISISPLGRFVPILGPLGYNMRKYQDECAEAWMNLAMENSRVMKIAEDLTAISAWGEVVATNGVVFVESLPETQARIAREAMTTQNKESSLQEMQARAEAIRQANMTPPHMPARDTSTGGPGDTIRVPMPPQFDPKKAGPPAPNVTPAAAMKPAKAGIVTPQEMGVRVPGEQPIDQAHQPFPASQPPNGRG